MRSSSRYTKAQFFILSAVTIISILFLISKLFEPSNVTDTSSVLLNEAPFVFENVREKAATILGGSRSCEEARYNLEEFKDFAEGYSLGKGYRLSFGYTPISCPAPSFSTNVIQNLTASGTFMESRYSLKWP